MEIKINNLTYKDIFEKLTIDISDNKVTSIIGKSGSGKTTLLNLLFGLYHVFSGYVIIDDKVINTEDDFRKIRSKISYLTQDIEDEMIYSNFSKNFKTNIKKITDEKYNDLIASFNITDNLLEKSSLDVSSSELKRLLLLKTFMTDANLIMLDDPTANLDQKSITNLIKLIKREKNNGKTIIVTSNDAEFLLKISDEIIVLNGKDTFKNTNKYEVFSNKKLLDSINLNMPEIINFKLIANKTKKIKLIYRDNINDLLKDVYRNA